MKKSEPSRRSGPLRGLRVLDLTTNVAGPSATMVLADLGADVIKIERPDGGDDGRGMTPHSGPWGACFVPINRGKRSLVLDLRRPEGREVVLRLAKLSDVFVENFRVGRLSALGLGEENVRAVRPDIIYASLSAFGARGPEHKKPGYDALLQARTGIVSVTGPSKGSECRAGVSIMDMGTGIWLALGVLAALFERQRSGRGQRVEGSLFQTGIMWMNYQLLIRQFTGVDPVPEGMRTPAFVPYGDFPTADGKILIGISNDRLFAQLTTAIGRPEWRSDPLFRTNRDRYKNRSQLERDLAMVFRGKSTAFWLNELEKHGVPSSAVQTVGQVLDDSQLEALGQLWAVELPGAEARWVRIPRLPIDLSLTPCEIAGRPPTLGEHGQAILEEAGLSGAEISDLAARGIILFPGNRS
jgi:crotonobetainyl-CoA:carnitine CoA-transferase CaiB-like acyl-CoA transferase